MYFCVFNSHLCAVGFWTNEISSCIGLKTSKCSVTFNLLLNVSTVCHLKKKKKKVSSERKQLRKKNLCNMILDLGSSYVKIRPSRPASNAVERFADVLIVINSIPAEKQCVLLALKWLGTNVVGTKVYRIAFSGILSSGGLLHSFMYIAHYPPDFNSPRRSHRPKHAAPLSPPAHI